ncbi:DUF4055 domain-containing protein [Sneathiella marina]|uniref:DUF4055 domain-containing protein n=1 Tax=Sneathiella marina TaxID=2950108 RepID=A0ABY4VYL9_9PROT|nr:DUF4055 domain-containing protein [Sneathiella marina]USG59940.1 DUF4055 domain-containing protein [Sneathiella marina]
MNDPSTPSLAYARMARRWALPQALMGGSLAMQAAGSRYLPRHPAEHGRTYAERARRSVLRNYFRRTVQKLTGRVLAEPLIIDTATPPVLVALLQNMDLMGRGLNIFARDWFQDALVNGLSHVLVDFPAHTEGGPDARPYAVQVTADQLIGAQWDICGQDNVLTQVRIREKATDYQGFEEKEVTQIRVLEPQSWSLYRADDRGDWQLRESGENSLGRIPLVTLYTNRTGFLEAAPPLEDLAFLNLEHYQIRSDQRNALNVASFPILAASGYDPEIDGAIEVGPNKVLTTTENEGRYYYVESSGAALAAGARELEALEAAMQQFGLQFETPTGRETATGRALDAADALSPLSAMTMNLEDSLNAVLALLARWLEIADFGAIGVSRSATGSGDRAADMQFLMAARQHGDISQDELLAEARQRGLLSDSLSVNGAGGG